MKKWHFLFLIIISISTSNAAIAAQDDISETEQDVPYNVSEARQACMQNGWQFVQSESQGIAREYAWKAPKGAWVNGAILLLHGGSGDHYQSCTKLFRLTNPQHRFAELAVKRGFAVFILNSTDKITDTNGRLCGKIWDDEPRNRPNLDLPYIHEIITQHIPAMRTAGSSPSVFLTGLSSGGYMSTRIATEMPELITAFAPVSNGDPYGWHRVCIPKPSGRKTVHGAGYDNDTGKEILERNSCDAKTGYKNEQPWPTTSANKPTFKLFHHSKDGINDFSCSERIRTQLLAHGFPEEERFSKGGLWRTISHHFWLDDYNEPMLDFFEKHTRHALNPPQN